MPGSLTLVELNGRMTDAATALVNFCSSLTEEQFFHQPENKWSVAQQLKHLIISTRTARLAYSLPKFIVRLVAGKPNRLSRSYDELVATYNFKLQQGGKASARYVPAKIPASTFGKKRLLTDFSGVTQKLTREAEKNWDEKKLNEYIVPHPLLGKITMRELYYFSIHHINHHLESIRKLTSQELNFTPEK